VDAARDLAAETGSAAFTVAQVATRAGSSLKGFYGVFAGKDDLLLALLAEESRAGATVLRELIDAGADGAPGSRVRAYVHGIFTMASLPASRGYARVLVLEHRRLTERRPAELAAALAPLLDLLAEEIAAAAPSADPARDATTAFDLVLGGVHAVSVGGSEPVELADYLFRFCWQGLAEPRTVPDPEPRGGTAP
jgi:AcrR family transcriptional regulator